MGRIQKLIRAAWYGLKIFYRAYAEGNSKLPASMAAINSIAAVFLALTSGIQAYANLWVYATLFFLYLTYKNRKHYWKKNSERVRQRLKGEQVYEQ